MYSTAYIINNVEYESSEKNKALCQVFPYLSAITNNRML